MMGRARSAGAIEGAHAVDLELPFPVPPVLSDLVTDPAPLGRTVTGRTVTGRTVTDQSATNEADST